MEVYTTGLVFTSVCAVFVAGSGVDGSVTGSTQESIQSAQNTSIHESSYVLSDSSSQFPGDGDDAASGIKEVFESMQLMGLEVLRNKTEVAVSARMKMSDIMFNPAMLVPQLIMWGFAPILLANLKMFVMQALMLNKMALSSAIFMTLRNIVFGPRPGPIVKYANYGYGQGQNKVYHHHRRS